MSFAFDEKSNEFAKIALAKYPDDRKQSAVMPFLDIAQRQNNNWLSQELLSMLQINLKCLLLKSGRLLHFIQCTIHNLLGKILFKFAQQHLVG